MFHYFNAIQNTKGDALTGYYVKLRDSNGDEADIFADESSTPIISVSEVANAAKVDSDGNVDFYVASGTYTLDVYATNATTLVKSIANVPMIDVGAVDNLTDGDKGDIIVSNSFATWAIDNNAVTNGKIRQSAGLSVIGRSANSTGDVADITGTDGQVFRVSGTTLGFGTIASAGIADGAVTYAKMQDVSATSRLLGRITSGAGDVEELTAANVKTILGLAQADISGLTAADSPQFTAINLGHASDTTITRVSAGNIAVEGNAIYRAGGTDIPLADGGTGASLADPGGDRIMFWDDSASQVTWLQLGTNLSITGTTLDASGSGGIADGDYGDIVVSVSGAAWTIDDQAVSYAKMQWIASPSKILGRITSGAGPIEELTGDNVRTITGLATTDSPQFTAINLGHASDTTIARSGAGDITIEGNAVYRAGGTDVPLADGGTGASLSDPGGDRIMFWDDSAGAVTWLTAGSGITITDTTISASGGGGGGSGTTLDRFLPQRAEQPSASYGTFDVRNGILVIDFDAGNDESVVFRGILPSTYTGGGLTLDIYWMATSATTGGVVWGAAIERAQDGGTDQDSDSFATEQNSAAVTTSGTSGIKNKSTITFSSGANMDSLAAGEPFRIKLGRRPGGVGDDMAGDAEFVEAHLKET